MEEDQEYHVKIESTELLYVFPYLQSVDDENILHKIEVVKDQNKLAKHITVYLNVDVDDHMQLLMADDALETAKLFYRMALNSGNWKLFKPH